MMTKFYLVLFAFLTTFSTQAQLSAPSAVESNIPLNWGLQKKSGTDSCGIYFNNYVGLAKTSSVRIESLRTGNITASGNYNGRAQKFNAPQPIEISGVEFYSYIENSLSDSLMVITLINNYDAVGNTLGTELARDTVYVTNDSFNPLFDPLPSISVQSQFDAPVVVTSDYMVSVYTPTDDSLRIIANDPFSNDGAGEGLGYALYDNSNYPSFMGWYDMLADFSFDYDFLISPLVSYDLAEEFSLSDTINCLNMMDHTCADYNQVPAFLSKQYNSNFASAFSSISIDWSDGPADLGVDSICHTYSAAGFYGVLVADTLHRWDITNPSCIVNVTDSILINSPSLVSITDTVCGSYTGPSGQIWTTSGIYIDTLVNSVACDSIITVNLVVNSSSTSTQTEIACGSFTSPSGQIWTTSGTYSDTIPNSTSCDSIITFMLTVNPAITNTINDTACYEYTSPTGQVWNNSGTYSDTLQSASSCDSIVTFNIVIVDSIDISFTFTQSNLDANFTTMSTNVDSVWWEFGDNSTGSSDFNPTHTYPGPGTYNVWLYSFNDCMTKALFKTIVIQPNSIGDNTINSFSLYPNPANQKITISGISGQSIISIYNIAGKTVFTSNQLNDKSTIDVSRLVNGTYFVRYESPGNSVTKKITIKH